ncbi:MAG: polyamine aminopropyltransferase [Leptolyngbyaceae cyanobacterium bins.349]|nr:polyamine aminopropyltransferase [Leptolyngbyaceae cyanobacterium bins.349]
MMDHASPQGTALKPAQYTRQQRNLLLLTAAASSSCGLAVELLLGTLASYLVGNQALAYGVAVGGFLAAMGLGAYLSRFIATSGSDRAQQHQLQTTFVWIELAIAPLSALIPLGLFALFVIDGPFWIALFLGTIILGTLAGMELPVLTRLLERDEGLKDALAGVLALDYVGALVGSLALPIILLPLIGMFPSAAVIGSIPAFMVVALAIAFPRLRQWGRYGLVLGVLLLLLAPFMVPLSDRLENTLYKAPVITRIQSPYQRIVLTRQGPDLRLFLDGDLQFSTLDEYRYHEALVHPALSANQLLQQAGGHEVEGIRRSVLVLGAGDGLALREVLKWPDVKQVVLIDLDRAVVNLARRQPLLVKTNASSYEDPRVQVMQADAFAAVPELQEPFDVIIADFPDPDQDAIAKLYSQGFYQRLLSRLAPAGVLVTQASSPFFAPKAFACVAATLESIGLKTYPYVVDVPSFGLWGFVMAARSPIQPAQLPLPVTTRFLNEPTLHNLFQLPKDIELGNVEINRLSHPVIVRYQANPRWAAYD